MMRWSKDRQAGRSGQWRTNKEIAAGCARHLAPCGALGKSPSSTSLRWNSVFRSRARLCPIVVTGAPPWCQVRRTLPPRTVAIRCGAQRDRSTPVRDAVPLAATAPLRAGRRGLAENRLAGSIRAAAGNARRRWGTATPLRARHDRLDRWRATQSVGSRWFYSATSMLLIGDTSFG